MQQGPTADPPPAPDPTVASPAKTETSPGRTVDGEAESMAPSSPRRRPRKGPRDSVRGSKSSSRCKVGVLPDFPWPVPSPSARMALPRGMLAKSAAAPKARLKTAANELDALLVAAGYSERSYFRLRAEGQTIGFALVTRMERIRSDGSPYPPEERFLPASAPDQFSVVDFLKSLFVAPVGYYRVLVFTVSKAPVKATGPAVNEDVARKWLATGGTRLLGCVAEMSFTDDYAIDALVYEFRHAPEEASQDPSKTVSQLTPSQLDPAIHLKRAGILSP